MDMLDDGYVRLTVDEVLCARLAHFVSGLDEQADVCTCCGARTTISGYTEWISSTRPAVTVGWDWVLDSECGVPRWRRVGLPRTNLLLIDRSCRDFEWRRSLVILGTVVDAMPWQEAARRAVAMRYAT
jgi:hypothetical protein